MGPETPDLSVVIPCYNEAAHLEESVGRLVEVLDVSRLEYEIVFVDDVSRDDTRRIITRLCDTYPRCRCIFHETNRGRGGAFKTGFAATRGRVTGFIDIDLEVGPQHIPTLVTQIEHHGYDVATGYRQYLLSQTGALHRHFMSIAYRGLCRFLLGLGAKDSETGYKFFNRATAGPIVMACENDGWFWDTEVMCRAELANLKILEMPVLFRRRGDKKSTVRLWHDIKEYLVALYRIRGRLGLSWSDRSPIYWTAHGYDFLMRLLYRRNYREMYAAVARLIPDGSSVVDLCCGTCRLYFDHLKPRPVDYLGLDANGHFVMSTRNRGASVRWFNVLTDEVPAADYVVMCSSFYHFHSREEEIFAKMRRAARRGVILSEPVRNLSAHRTRAFGGLMNRLTNPGVGDFDFRYDLESFRTFAERHGATQFLHEPGQRNAVILFENGRAADHEPRLARLAPVTG